MKHCKTRTIKNCAKAAPNPDHYALFDSPNKMFVGHTSTQLLL